MKALFLLLLPLHVFGQRAENMLLTGTFQLPHPVAEVYLSYRTPEAAVTDSVQVRDGTFAYKTKLIEPTLVSLRVRYAGGLLNQKSQPVMLFLQPGKQVLTIRDSLENAVMSGSAAHDDYQVLVKQQQPYKDSLRQLYDAWDQYSGPNDKERRQAIETAIDSLDAKMLEAVNKTFVETHPASPVAVFALTQYAGYEIDAERVAPLLARLSKNARQLPAAVRLAAEIEIAQQTGIGRTAPNFTQADTAGKAVSLSQFRGRYVLVDFWASWCGPCRAENPNVVTAFNQYKDQGFTVLGVSLDRPGAKDRWLKAIHDDSLTWTHVSDLKFWNNAVAKQYGIRAIPQNLLIDPQGTIIGRNLRGQALTQKLATLFGAKETF